MKQVIRQELVQQPISVVWDEYESQTSPGVMLRRPIGIQNLTTQAALVPILWLAGSRYGWI